MALDEFSASETPSAISFEDDLFHVGRCVPLKDGFFVKEIVEVMGSGAHIVPIPSEELRESGLELWMDIPLWFSRDAVFPNQRLTMDCRMEFTPFVDSVRATRAYYETLGWPVPRAGISLARECALIKAHRTSEERA